MLGNSPDKPSEDKPDKQAKRGAVVAYCGRVPVRVQGCVKKHTPRKRPRAPPRKRVRARASRPPAPARVSA